MHPLNRAAFNVWGTVKNQWRFSFDGPVALDIVAVDIAVRRKGIPKNMVLIVTEQVLSIGDVIIEESRRERAKREQAKARRNAE